MHKIIWYVYCFPWNLLDINLTWVQRRRAERGSLARSLSSLLVQEIASQVIVSCLGRTTEERWRKREEQSRAWSDGRGRTRRDDELYNSSFKLIVFVNGWLVQTWIKDRARALNPTLPHDVAMLRLCSRLHRWWATSSSSITWTRTQSSAFRLFHHTSTTVVRHFTLTLFT